MSDLQECLLQLAAEGNPKFTRALHPGIENILGLRVPDVRNLARRVAASPDWERQLAELEHTYMEERMLHGMVLGYVKSLPLEERLEGLWFRARIWQRKPFFLTAAEIVWKHTEIQKQLTDFSMKSGK